MRERGEFPRRRIYAPLSTKKEPVSKKSRLIKKGVKRIVPGFQRGN